MERREFVRMTCSLCMLAGAGASITALSSCSSSEVYTTELNERKIVIPRSAQKGKSVLIVRPENFEYDVALEERHDGSFFALLLRCTHASNPLDFNGNGFTCSLHGSQFNDQGIVTRGPASQPLQRLKATIDGDKIIIEL